MVGLAGTSFREVTLLTLVGVTTSFTRPTVKIKIKIVSVHLDNFERFERHKPVALTSGSGSGSNKTFSLHDALTFAAIKQQLFNWNLVASR